MSQQERSKQNQRQTEPEAGDENTAILHLIETIFGELSQSVTVVLGLSNFVLAEIDHNEQISTDLAVIMKQAQRMRELVEGINYVTRYKTSL